MMNGRVIYLDVARGVAMICIVVLHLTIFNFSGAASEAVGHFCHSFDTRLLFFLSGMTAAITLGGSCKGFRECITIIKKKTRTLFLPFMVWSVIVLPYVYNRGEWTEFFKNLFLPFDPKTGGYWFLLYIFVFQLLLIGIRFLSNQLASRISNEFVGEILIAAVLSLTLFPIYEYVLLFLLGYFVHKYWQKYFYNELFTFASFVFFICLYVYGQSWAEYFVVRLAMAFFACSTILGVLRKMNKPEVGGGILAYFGRNSLEIYLIHFLLAAITRDWVIETDRLFAIPLFFLLIGVAICICWLCCKISEVLKINSYLAFILFGKA